MYIFIYLFIYQVIPPENKTSGLRCLERDYRKGLLKGCINHGLMSFCNFKNYVCRKIVRILTKTGSEKFTSMFLLGFHKHPIHRCS